MHVMKYLNKRPLLRHDYCSSRDDMFGLAWTDIMVHLPSSTNRRPEQNASYRPSYLTFSGNPFLVLVVGRLIRIPVKVKRDSDNGQQTT